MMSELLCPQKASLFIPHGMQGRVMVWNENETGTCLLSWSIPVFVHIEIKDENEKFSTWLRVLLAYPPF